MKIKLAYNNSYYLTLFLFISLGVLSIISIPLGALDFRVLDLVIVGFFLYLFSLLILIKKPRVVYNKLTIPSRLLILHLFTLSLYPFLGFFLKGFLDLSLILRWFQLSFFVFLFLILLKSNDYFIKGLRNALLISGILNLIYGILMLSEFIGVVPYGTLPHHDLGEIFNWKTDHFMRVTALFSGPNQLGWYSLMAILLSIGVLMDIRFKKDKVWRYIFILHLFLILLSTARTAILVLFFVFFTIFFIGFFKFMSNSKFKKKSFLNLITSIISISGIIYVGILFDLFRLESILRAINVVSNLDESADSSFAARLIFWRNAIDVFFKDHFPLGTMVTPTIYTGTIDSGWVTYFVQSGLLYVFTFSLMMFVSIAYSVKLFFKKSKHYMYLILILSCIGLSIGQVTLSPFHYLPVLFLFVAIIKLSSHKNTQISFDK